MAASVAANHTWQLPANDSQSMEGTPNGPNRALQDSSDRGEQSANAVATTTDGASMGHGHSASQGQIYQSPFPATMSQWTPSPNAAPFYPQFNPFFPGHTPPVAPQPQYFDPNQQIAWAYQQMMFQQAALAQQHQQQQFNQAMAEYGRNRTNSGPQQSDFFQPQSSPHPPPMVPGFPFQSGTPPAHPHAAYNNGSFRRGPGQQHFPPRANTLDNQDWSRLTAQNYPAPYSRSDAAGSSHSVNSSNGSGQASPGGGARQRANSNNTNASQTHTPPGSLRGGSGGGPPMRGSTVPQLNTDLERLRQPHNRQFSAGGPPSPSNHSRAPHQRTISNASDRSSARSQGSSATATTASGTNNASTAPSSATAAATANSSSGLSPISRTPQRTPAKPSPLSQQQTFTEPSANSKRAKRLSKDDSELLPATTVASALTPRQSGLKGRFKRALAFNPPSSVDEHGDSPSSVGHAESGTSSALTATNGETGDQISSPITPQNAGESVRSTKPKNRAAALFREKFNASTDNISLSSTVSSASVMIRKLGSIGKLARRNSLMGITSIFKGDKNKEKGEGTSGIGKKSRKAGKAEPSVSHVTAELDRMGVEDESLSGLSPAAKLARQHTLKSNAEAAARRLREQAAAASATSNAANGAPVPNGGAAVPSSWEKNTTTGHRNQTNRNVSEDGTLKEDSDGSGEGGYDPQFDADATLRLAGVDEESEEDDEPWAVGVRRSLERTRQPGKAVIRNHIGYRQEQHLDPPNQPFAARIRSNSYQTVSESTPGPLAHLPSPDPDHIDGLQRSSSTSNTPEKKPFSLPVFSFETGDLSSLSETKEADQSANSQDVLSTGGAIANASDKPPTFAYTHPTANSSAPALSTMFNTNGTNTGSNTTSPANPLKGMKKNISFAATLSIYDTFSGSVYDRRSEPSTANRLTPALAQKIKEELNSFKMEEMEVHYASRIHTHFFV